MANHGSGSDSAKPVKRRVSTRPVLRLIGRTAAGALALLVVTMVSIQFGRIIGRDIGEAHELSAVRAQIGELQKRRAQQQVQIRRLRDPVGAVPEIHDRLRMVLPNEELIFVSPAPLPTR
jgi:hypothetical protein